MSFGITETYIIPFLMVAGENRGYFPSSFPAATGVTALEGSPLRAAEGETVMD